MSSTSAGSVQLIYSDASGTRRDVVYGPMRTEKLAVATDPRQQLIVPYLSGSPLRENDKFVFSVMTDSASSVNNTSTILIPVTIKNLKTGIERETYLNAANFGLTATDVNTLATGYSDVGVYTVNAQEALKLGHKTSANSVVYIQLNYT